MPLDALFRLADIAPNLLSLVLREAVLILREPILHALRHPILGSRLCGGSDMDTARIRALNDAFRKAFVGGKVLLTVGVSELPDPDRAAVLDKVRKFDAFDANNDPHGEHDFVEVEHAGERYFAKIDYYAPDLRFGSEQPAEPERTIRVLTIMRADEY